MYTIYNLYYILDYGHYWRYLYEFITMDYYDNTNIGFRE